MQRDVEQERKDCLGTVHAIADSRTFSKKNQFVSTHSNVELVGLLMKKKMKNMMTKL